MWITECQYWPQEKTRKRLERLLCSVRSVAKTFRVIASLCIYVPAGKLLVIRDMRGSISYLRTIEVALPAHFQFFPIYMSQNRRSINLKTCFIVFFCIFVLIYIEKEAINITRIQQLPILLVIRHNFENAVA